ncbi:MAG TPA: glycosyltransferase family 39 protein, partial [Nitrospira sp.]|nr:glycosyltransferase family 39 protein [Nitrospira sp.]
CGLLTFPASYFLIRRLFGRQVALLTSAWLAVSLWHVMYSRIGLRTIMLPLVLAAAFYFLWLGLDRVAVERQVPDLVGMGWFVLAGGLLGIAQYTYTTARLAPIVVLVFSAYLAVFHRQLFLRALPGLIAAGLSAVLVFAPEGWYFLHHLDDFTKRAQEVSVFNQSLATGLNLSTPGSALIYSAVRSIGMFTFHGDDQWDRNIPGRPIFDPVSSVWFVVGIILIIRRSREPRYAFLLIWLLLMLVPSILSLRNVPNFLRVTGLIPALFTLPALGVNELWNEWNKRTPNWLHLLPVGVLAVAFIAGTYQTYQDYFGLWAHAVSVSETFSSDRLLASGAGRVVAQQTGKQVFVGSGDEDESVQRYALMAANANPRVRVFTSPRSLVVPVGNSPLVYIFPRRFLPPQPLLDRCFGGVTPRTVEVASDGESVLRYDLAAPCGNLEPEHPLLASFGQSFQVLGFDFPHDVPAGGVLTVRWYWKIIGSDSRDLSFFNQFYDSNQRRLSQIDDRAFAPTYWPVGTTGVSTYDLQIGADLPTGAYSLQVGAYTRDSLTHLPVIDSLGRTAGTEITLGPIKVHGTQPTLPTIPRPQSVQFADGIQFLGSGLAPNPATAGQPLAVTLYWSTDARPSRDYTVFVHLLNDHDRLLAQTDSPPQSGHYPTSIWDAGETIADRHVLSVPANLLPGSYQVEVGLYRHDSGQRLSILDSAGRPQADRILISGVNVSR